MNDLHERRARTADESAFGGEMNLQKLLERAEGLMARMLSGHSPRFSRSIDRSSHYRPNDEEGRFKVVERVTKANAERKVW